MTQPDQKMPLGLTETERKLILDDLMYVDDQYTSIVRTTPMDQPVSFSLGGWQGLLGCIAAEASQARDKRFKKELDRLCEKINGLLEKSPNDAPSLKIYRGHDEETDSV